MNFFWYDYETWGKSPHRDRIVQFGGMRTNENLELIGEPIQLLCRPGLDCRIGPGAVNVHKIMPMEAHRNGLSEAEFAGLIHDELSQAGTCSVAYNGMNFDHEFTRVLFYRNLRDPYKWMWDQENSNWDTIELMRAAYLLYPEALQYWPKKADGGPSFKLEDLSIANLDGAAKGHHDAITDVTQMWKITKFIHGRARNLWDYALNLRFKKNVQSIMDKGEPVLYVVGGKYIGTKRCCATLLSNLDILGQDINKSYCFDLFYDPTCLLKPFSQWTSKDKSYAHRAIQFVKRNKSPFVCRMSKVKQLLSSELSFSDIMKKMQLKESEVHARHEMLKEYMNQETESSLIQYIESREANSWSHNDVEPDEALYENFISEQDRILMDQVLQEGANFDWRNVQSDDPRVEPLIFQFLARNYPQILDDDEATGRWHAYCRSRQLEKKESRRITADQIFSYELRDNMEPWGTLGESEINDLSRWQDRVREVLRKGGR